MLSNGDRGLYDPALFPMTAGVTDHALIDDIGHADNDSLTVALIRMDFESHALLPIFFKRTHLECVQCGCSGTCIDLGFDISQSERRKLHPFAPAKRQ